MPLVGAAGSARSHLGHVDLVDVVEAAGGVGGKHACHARRERGAGDNMKTAFARFGIEVEEALDVVDRVGGRHDMSPILEGVLHQRTLPHRCGQEQHVTGGWQRSVAVGLAGGLPQRLHHRSAHGPVAFDDDELADTAERHQLTSGARANRSRADEDDPH